MSYDLIVIGAGTGRLRLRGACRPTRFEDRLSSRSAARLVAHASISAASLQRRCCTPPNCSRKRITALPHSESTSPRQKLNLPAMMKHKADTVKANVDGVVVPDEEEQG